MNYRKVPLSENKKRNEGYSKDALVALATGAYGKQRKKDIQDFHIQDVRRQAGTLPKLESPKQSKSTSAPKNRGTNYTPNEKKRVRSSNRGTPYTPDYKKKKDYAIVQTEFGALPVSLTTSEEPKKEEKKKATMPTTLNGVKKKSVPALLPNVTPAKKQTESEKKQEAKFNDLLANVEAEVNPTVNPLLANPNQEDNGLTLEALGAMKAYQDAKKPSSRYVGTGAEEYLSRELPEYDKKYEKDFEEFFENRYEWADRIDTDPVTLDSVPHWQTVQKEIMNKYGWTEDEFNEKFGAYNAYRNAKTNQEDVADMIDLADKHPFLGSVFSTLALAPEVTLEGIDSGLRGLANIVADQNPALNMIPEDKRSEIPALANLDSYLNSQPDNVATLTREAMRNKVAQKTGDLDWLYNAGMGLADLGTNMALTGGSSLGMGLISGAQNAAQNAQHALERGIDPKKASEYAFLTGSVAGVMNTVGLDFLKSKKLFQPLLKQLGEKAGIEALENVAEDISDKFIDDVMNNDKSEWKQLINYYENNGITPEEATKLAWFDFFKQEATSALSGAAMGSLFGTVQNAGRIVPEVRSWLDYKTDNTDVVEAVRNGMSAEEAIEKFGKITEPDVKTPEAEAPQTRMDTDFAENAEEIPSEDVKTSEGISPDEQARIVAEAQAKALEEERARIQAEEQAKAQAEAVAEAELPKEEITQEPVNSDEPLEDVEPEQKPVQNYTNEQLAEIKDFETRRDALKAEMNKSANPFDVEGMKRLGELSKESKALTAEMQGKYPELFDSSGKYIGMSEGTVTTPAPKAEAPKAEETRVEEPKAEFNAEVPNVKVELGTEEPSNERIMSNDTGLRSEAPQEKVPEFTLTERVPQGEGYHEEGMSDVMTNTMVNAGIIDKSALKKNKALKEIARVDKHNNSDTYAKAYKEVDENGDKLYQEYADGREVKSDQDVDEVMIMLENLRDQLEEAKDAETRKAIIAKRNILMQRATDAGHRGGQMIQAFAKWNDTADGAIINGEHILTNRIDPEHEGSRNVKTIQRGNKIAQALAKLGNRTKYNVVDAPKKSHAELKEDIRKLIDERFGEKHKFTEDDLEFLTILAEDKGVQVWQIVDEIEHKLATGDWYSLDESTEPKRPENPQLRKAFEKLIERPNESAESAKPTLKELREQVRNTLEREYASFGYGKKKGSKDYIEITDDDVDYLANMISEGATADELSDAMAKKLITGTFGISADTQTKVNELFKIADVLGHNSEDGVNAKLEAYKLIANEVCGKASGWDKFDAWRYLAMLGNPKTMVRNKVGNAMFNAVTSFSNSLSALLETGTHYGIRAGKWVSNKLFKTNFDTSKGMNRTKTLLNPLAVAQWSIDSFGRDFGSTKLGQKMGVHELTGDTLKDTKLLTAARQDGRLNRWSRISSTKWNKMNTQDKIKSAKSPFDTKAIQFWEKLTDKGVSDTGAVLYKYSTSLAGFLKANGLDDDAFKAETRYERLRHKAETTHLTDAEKADMEEYKRQADLLEKGRDYALDQAEYATFHEANAVADWLSQFIMKGANSKRLFPRIGAKIVQGNIPFLGTPANIARSGFEFSPLNSVVTLGKAIKMIYENTGKRKGNLAETYKGKSGLEHHLETGAGLLDSLSKTITGTGLFALGYVLKNNGLLNSSFDDEKNQDKLEGRQDYSIQIGDYNFTIDWAAPAVMPLLAGAELQKILERNGVSAKEVYENPDAWLQTANALLDPYFETSMMSGIQNSLNAAANQTRYSEGNSSVGGMAGAMLTNALTGYFTQGNPTINGQIARIVDPTRRSTDTVAQSAFGSEAERVLRQQMNKVPGLSYLNRPYVDAYGREQTNYPGGEEGLLPALANIPYQFLSPAYIDKVEQEPADVMGRQIFDSTVKDEEGNDVPIRDKKIFANTKYSVTVNGKKLTPDQKYDYDKRSGEANLEIRNKLAGEDWFKKLDPIKQKEIFTSIGTLADKIGKKPYDPSVSGDDLDAYTNGKVDGVVEYYKQKYIKQNIHDETGLSSNTLASQEIQKAAQEDPERAQEMIEDSKTLADYGLTSAAANQTWITAQQNVPSVTIQEFAPTFNEIDNLGKDDKRNNGAISKDEFSAWLMLKNPSEAEAQKYTDIYYTKTNKKGQKRKVKKTDKGWDFYY